MTALIYALLGLFVFALIVGLIRIRWYDKKIEKGEVEEMPGVERPRPDGCCGQHEICEKESLLAAVSKDIEYYEDEHLDRFRNRPSDCYSDEEVEEFQDVLFTMRNDEVAGWVRSLQLRGINLPDDLKDDVIMIVDERRSQGHG